MQSDFLERVRQDLGDLKRQQRELLTREVRIRQERDRLAERIEALREAARVYREVMALPEPDKETPPESGLFDHIPPGTIADMAEFVVRERAAPTRVADIARALESVGKLSTEGDDSGRGNYGTVYGTLRRDARFVKTGQGEFDLRDREETAAPELTLSASPTQPGFSDRR